MEVLAHYQTGQFANEEKPPMFTKFANIAHAGIKRQGYTSGRELFAFSGPARILRLCQVLFSSFLSTKFLFCPEPVKGV